MFVKNGACAWIVLGGMIMGEEVLKEVKMATRC